MCAFEPYRPTGIKVSDEKIIDSIVYIDTIVDIIIFI